MASELSFPLTYLHYGFASIVTITFAYGLYVGMTAMTWFHLRTPAARQGRRFIVAYTVTMFIVTFAAYLSEAVILDATLVEAPAGTPETSNILICSPWSITYLVLSTLQFLLSDALLVYRTYILFRDQKAFMIPPIVLWIGLAGLGVAQFVTSCGLEVEHGEPANYVLYFSVSTAWLAVTATLQIVTTGMIVLKLLHHRRAVNKQLAAAGNGLGYISLSGILAESAALYTICTIAYIPMVRSSSPVQIWWGMVVNSLVFLNPAFIILRVAMGQSYTAISSRTPHSALQFSARSTAGQDSTIFPAKAEDLEMSVQCEVAKHVV